MRRNTQPGSYAPGEHAVNWYAVSREMLSHPVVGAGSLGKHSHFEAMHWLIANAAIWKSTIIVGGHEVTLQRGELLASLGFLAKTWRWTPAAVRWFLTNLERTKSITRRNIEHSKKSAVIRLCNYDRFQLSTHEQQHDAQHDVQHEVQQQANNKQKTILKDPPIVPPKIEEIAFEQWNTLAARLRLPVAGKLTIGRRQRLRQRLAEHGEEAWQRALQAVERSKFLRGDNDRKWRCSLDFLLQASSFAKVLDGTYGAGNWKPPVSTSAPVRVVSETDLDAKADRLCGGELGRLAHAEHWLLTLWHHCRKVGELPSDEQVADMRRQTAAHSRLVDSCKSETADDYAKSLLPSAMGMRKREAELATRLGWS